jgi:hypothetical protein
MAQKVGLILVLIGIGGILTASSRRKGEHIDQPLEGFDTMRPMGLSDRIIKWKGTWHPGPIGLPCTHKSGLSQFPSKEDRFKPLQAMD